MPHEFSDYTGNKEKFDKEWLPKIQAYRKELADNLIKEYMVPEELIPTTSWFDATKIPAKVMSEKELEITNSNATVLVEKMAKGELSAVDTFNAFAKRATIAHQLTSCVQQFFIPEGLARAKALDEIFAKTGKTVGPLHGLPISFKEHIGFKGKTTHATYVSYLDLIPEEDAASVQILRKAGAVFFARTSAPQCMMAMDSNNNVTGPTKNPHNTSLTPGGSTSGEGALIGMGGSPMGVGTDSGGSIRGPSAFCGLWGLRPTNYRTSMRGSISAAGNGQETIPTSQGPLTRSADDINLFMKAYAEEQPWKYDATLPPLPWRSVEKPLAKDLTIAVIKDDGIVRPTAPINRGLEYSVEKLKAAGVKVVEWEPYRITDAIQVAAKFFTADGNFKQKQALAASGEEVLALTSSAFAMSGDDGITVHENHLLNALRDELRNAYQERMDEQNIDFILGPVHPYVAGVPNIRHYGVYLFLMNVLDFPGLVFPTGLRQDPKVDIEVDFKPRNDTEAFEHSLYDPSLFENAPIGLQLNGRRFEDEKLVQAGKLLHEIITA